MPRPGQTFEEHMGTRMRAFKKGQMHSSKKRTGPKVMKRSQAIAIALSEARKAGMKGAPKIMHGSGPLYGSDCLKKVGAM